MQKAFRQKDKKFKPNKINRLINKTNFICDNSKHFRMVHPGTVRQEKKKKRLVI